LLNHADFYTDLVPEPDLAATASVLWGSAPAGVTAPKEVLEGDWLYVYVEVFDNEFFVHPENVWESDQILVGIDPTHAGDSLYDSSFGGAPGNAPDMGPYTYKIDLNAITLNWDPFPADTGWVVGTIFSDSTTLIWGVEFAAYIGEAGTAKTSAARQIGFNIGGAQASQTVLDQGAGEATYGFYSHWICDPDENAGEFCTFAGGAVMSHAGSFGTLELVEGTGTASEEVAAEIPNKISLSPNYPNPFNPSTTIEFGLPQSARATIDVYNMYGQRVATLVDDQRAAGTYRVSFDASGLPSGTYLYQLSIDGNVMESQKMILIK
jgi:hypothetical protein